MSSGFRNPEKPEEFTEPICPGRIFSHKIINAPIPVMLTGFDANQLIKGAGVPIPVVLALFDKTIVKISLTHGLSNL